jgi:hypothetical protein
LRFQHTWKLSRHETQRSEDVFHMKGGAIFPQTTRGDRYNTSRSSVLRRLKRHATSERISNQIYRDIDAKFLNGILECFN